MLSHAVAGRSLWPEMTMRDADVRVAQGGKSILTDKTGMKVENSFLCRIHSDAACCMIAKTTSTGRCIITHWSSTTHCHFIIISLSSHFTTWIWMICFRESSLFKARRWLGFLAAEQQCFYTDINTFLNDIFKGWKKRKALKSSVKIFMYKSETTAFVFMLKECTVGVVNRCVNTGNCSYMNYVKWLTSYQSSDLKMWKIRNVHVSRRVSHLG